MAGHLPIMNYVGETDKETKAIHEIVAHIQAHGVEGLEELPPEYAFDGSDKAYLKRKVEVPEEIVWGGQASIEVHTKDNKLHEIYLVA